MSTARSFQNMLNEYLPNKLLMEEMLKRDYFLSNIEIDNKWKGGNLVVPFKAAGASSISMGSLTAATDIAEDKYVRGFIPDYKEMWGSMIFNERDLVDHSGRIVEDSFLKILPDTVESFMDTMKMTVSVQLGTGPQFATLTVSGTVAGVLEIDKIDRVQIGQKIILADDNSADLTVYVISIDVNGGTLLQGALVVSLTRGGVAADVSAYTVAQNAKLYTDGAKTGAFQSIKSALLSAVNGGAATLHGQSKILYPFLQAVNVSGAAISAANILDKLFDAYTAVRQKAKGKADTFVMSYKHLGSVMKAIENKSNGQANWNISSEGKKASIYGWDEMYITSVKGTLKVVGIQEMDNDVIFMLDMASMTFRSNGFFRKRKNPQTGQEYFEVRNTTGFQYIIDTCLFGELEVTKPGNNGIIFSIPNY
jgi:hypothetical protein